MSSSPAGLAAFLKDNLMDHMLGEQCSLVSLFAWSWDSASISITASEWPMY